MKIEVWSDFACPFCYIGKKRLETALGRFAHGGEVKVEFKSFELDPRAPREIEHDVHDMLSAKYGMSREQAIAMNRNLSDQAQAAGLLFQFDTLKLTNTFDAHRLAQYAAEQGKGDAVVQALFRAYFSDSRHLGDHAVLADLAQEAGLDRDEAVKLLADNSYSAEVRADEAQARQLGVTGVPFFVIDGKYAVSGAQSEEAWERALQAAWAEASPLEASSAPATDEDQAEACGDDACPVPDQADRG